MTTPDDGQREDPVNGTPDGHVEPDLPFDEDAAWRSIIENYGERPRLGPLTVEPTPLEPPPAPPRVDPVELSPFDRSYLDAHDPARTEHRDEDEDQHERPDRHEHFVPPVPPPVPRGTPARRLAWAGLFGPPALMILAVAFGWTFPGALSFALVAGFVGGFVFLVATMPRDRDEDGDDGAVV
jgi:hypothetical protein